MSSFDSRDMITAHLKAVKAREWNRPLIGYDLETDGFDGPITVAGFASPGGAVAVLPDKLAHALSRAQAPVVAHNLAFDIRKTAEAGLSLPSGVLLDTIIMAHLLDDNACRRGGLGLDALALEHLNRKLKTWEEVKDDPEALATYVMEDAKAARDLALLFWERLEKEGLLRYFLNIDMPTIPIIAEMEMRGIRVDEARLRQKEREYSALAKELEAKLRTMLPSAFTDCQRERCEDGTFHAKVGDPRPCVWCGGTGRNDKLFNSDKQMAEVLFEHYGLPVLDRSDKTDQPSTNKTVLKRLRSMADGEAREFLHTFLEYRKVEKIGSTYMPSWLELMRNGRIYSKPNPTGTVTGRWSYSEPNLQNVPPDVRDVFIPDEGKAFISCDFTQIELYLLAVASGEDEIIEAYERGDDLHARTAEIMGFDDPTGTGRSGGKTGNFAIVYGLSANSLADRLNISKGAAKEIYTRIYSQYRRLPDYREERIEEASERGYVTTLFGRKRRVEGIKSPKHKVRYHAENQAVNSPIQGGAGDLIKAAMIYTKMEVPEAEPLLQIHDEMLYQAPKEHAEEIAEEVANCFRNCYGGLKPRAEATVMERWIKD